MTNSCFITQPNLEKNTCKNKERTANNTLEASGITILEKQKTLWEETKTKTKSDKQKHGKKTKNFPEVLGMGQGDHES